MVRSFSHHCLFIFVATIFLASACVNNDHAEEGQNPNPQRCEDCVQPPLLRADLIPHLQQNQERILAREDYLLNLPPAVSEIIYGPIPDETLRAGPEVVDTQGEPFSGDINWHHVAFDDVITDEAEHDSLRGRNVSGAHCFFAQKPNRYTAVFALFVLHHRDRGDVLYLGGPHHEEIRVDTVAITDRYQSRIRVRTDHIHCAFRNDQNRMGALIIPFEPIDLRDTEEPHYAVFTVTTGEERRATGEMMTIERSAGSRSRELVDEEVPVTKYPTPRSEFVDSFSDLHEALNAADEAIPQGRFRLRPEFVYPTMPWKSYLDSGEHEFCPTNAECEAPREHFDADIVPPLPTFEEEAPGEDEEMSEE